MSRSARTQQQSPQNWSQSERKRFAAACNLVTVRFEEDKEFWERTYRLDRLHRSQHGKQPTPADLESAVQADIAEAYYTLREGAKRVTSDIGAAAERFHGHYVKAARFMMFDNLRDVFNFLYVLPSFLSAEDERDDRTNRPFCYLPDTPPPYPSETPPTEQSDIDDADSLSRQNMQRDTEISRLPSTRPRSSSRPKKAAFQSHRLPPSQAPRRSSRVSKPAVKSLRQGSRSDIRPMPRKSQKPQGRLKSKR